MRFTVLMNTAPPGFVSASSCRTKPSGSLTCSTTSKLTTASNLAPAAATSSAVVAWYVTRRDMPGSFAA